MATQQGLHRIGKESEFQRLNLTSVDRAPFSFSSYRKFKNSFVDCVLNKSLLGEAGDVVGVMILILFACNSNVHNLFDS